MNSPAGHRRRDGNGQEEARTRSRLGLGVDIALLVVMAVPACNASQFALASFTDSNPPEPAVVTLWAGIRVLLSEPSGCRRGADSAGPKATPPCPVEARWLTIAVLAVALHGGWADRTASRLIASR